MASLGLSSCTLLSAVVDCCRSETSTIPSVSATSILEHHFPPISGNTKGASLYSFYSLKMSIDVNSFCKDTILRPQNKETKLPLENLHVCN